MGYTTEFEGCIRIEPPLNDKEIAYLTKFSESRRMLCVQGPYYVDRGGYMGQDSGPDVLNYNRPPAGQPGLWCHWVPTEDGTAIEWDGGEKLYEADLWMAYLIAHFLTPNAYAKSELPFLQGHTCNGESFAQGEDSSDRWILYVQDNKVIVAPVELTPNMAKAQTITAEPPSPLPAPNQALEG